MERNLLETLVSASSGHSMNQSMVQQLIREGELAASRPESLAHGGHAQDDVEVVAHAVDERAKETSLPVGVQAKAYSRMSGHHSIFRPGSNSPGTSPLLRMLLMSSTKPSVTICVSVNKNTVGVPVDASERTGS